MNCVLWILLCVYWRLLYLWWVSSAFQITWLVIKCFSFFFLPRILLFFRSRSFFAFFRVVRMIFDSKRSLDILFKLFLCRYCIYTWLDYWNYLLKSNKVYFVSKIIRKLAKKLKKSPFKLRHHIKKFYFCFYGWYFYRNYKFWSRITSLCNNWIRKLKSMNHWLRKENEAWLNSIVSSISVK